MTDDTDDTAELRERIAAEREQLGDTVAELAGRLDVPARAKEQGRQAVETAKTQGRHAVDTARTQGRQVVDTARTQGRQAVETTKTQGRQVVDTALTQGRKVVVQGRGVVVGVRDRVAAGDRRPILVAAGLLGFVVTFLLVGSRRRR